VSADTLTNMLKLMCIPTSMYDGVVRTSDGYYTAHIKGDVGYNAFLGKPGPRHGGPGRKWMLDTWNGLSLDEKRAVVYLSAHPGDGSPIRLKDDFGVPVEDARSLSGALPG